MSDKRFGSNSLDEIDERIGDLTPANTKISNISTWKQFEQFCSEKGYVLNEKTSVPKLAEILKDFGFNMKKQGGSDYKEGVIKTHWNRIAKMLQEKFYKEFNVSFDPFKDVEFQNARNARDAKRKQLQASSENRKSSAAALNVEELAKIINLWDENTPEELQRKFYHIVSCELAWRGGEVASCLTKFFEEEDDNIGNPTGRII